MFSSKALVRDLTASVSSSAAIRGSSFSSIWNEHTKEWKTAKAIGRHPYKAKL